MQKIHVLLKKEELDAQRLDGKVVVVLDILFATSSIVTALAHGATEVIPTLDGRAAQEAAKAFPPAPTCCPANSMPTPCPASCTRRRRRCSPKASPAAA
jgi:hypothetical protein